MIWPHSFFIPKRTFTWQLRKPMDCIWNYNIGIFFFFFCFNYCGLKQNTSLVSNAQLITVLRLKGHIMEEAQGTCSVLFGLCHQKHQAIGFWKAGVHQLCTPAFNPTDTGSLCSSLSSLSLPLAWGCSLPPGHRARGAQRQLTGGTPECFNIFKIHIWFGITIKTSYN